MKLLERVAQIAAVGAIGIVAGIVLAYPGDDPDTTWQGKIPYRGQLTENGASITDTVALEMSLYPDVSTSTALWSETLAGVPVSDGLFSVVMGEDPGNPIPPAVFARSQLYLGVTVNGSTLAGRQRILAVPFATHAATPVAPGVLVPFAGTTPPVGWLLCNGDGLSSTMYPALFQAIGTAYGDGTDNCTGACDFNLPDLRGRFLRGADLGAGNDPDAGARAASATGGASSGVGSLQGSATAVPNSGWAMSTDGDHAHELAVTGSDDNNHSGSIDAVADSDTAIVQRIRTTTANGDHTHTVSGGDTESRPVNVAVHWIVKI